MVTADDAYRRETAAVAERVLAAALGGPVRLGAARALQGRAGVHRIAVTAGPPGAPTSVVVKRVPPGQDYDPAVTAYPASAWALFNNWAGLTFLEEVASEAALAPRCYGGDRQVGLVVVEDLGDAPGLHDLLLGGDAAAAEAGLLDFAAVLGRLHARTAGRAAAYRRRRRALGPVARTAFYSYAWLAATFARTVATLGIAPAAGAGRDVEAVIAAVRAPGPWLAYTHGDPCPDNCLLVGGRARLLDLDRGEFRHALTDGVYGRLLFPTCWCVRRVPAPVLGRMEAAYRAELARGCPAAADDGAFGRAVAAACAYWVLTEWEYNLPAVWERDIALNHGLATMREAMIARLEAAAQTSAASGQLETLGDTFCAVATALRTRWQVAGPVLPPYPAFRTGATPGR